jgi:hypothetical protein
LGPPGSIVGVGSREPLHMVRHVVDYSGDFPAQVSRSAPVASLSSSAEGGSESRMMSPRFAGLWPLAVGAVGLRACVPARVIDDVVISAPAPLDPAVGQQRAVIVDIDLIEREDIR